MFWLRLIYSRLYGLLRKNRIEQEMDDEMRFHLLMRTRQNIERGMRPDEAELEARRRFGNVGRIKDQARDIKGGGLMESLLQDMRYGARMLLKHKGSTAIAVLSLALGIGAYTALFSLADAFLWRALPGVDNDRLFTLVRGDGMTWPSSYPDYILYRDRSQSLAGLAAYEPVALAFGNKERSRLVAGELVTGNFFEVLGVAMSQGRAFLPDEDRTPGAHPVVVVSHDFWVSEFGGDPQLIGKTVTLNNQSFTVIGVAKPGFAGITNPLPAEFWIPTMMQAVAKPNVPPALTLRSVGLWLIGSLKEGVSREQAEAELNAINRQLLQEYPPSEEVDSWRALPLSLAPAQGTLFTGLRIRVAAVIIMAMVLAGMVLLIGCANVANLLLARGAMRYKEIALRLAVGASRMRLIRQLLTESLLLALLAAAGGLILAFWINQLLMSLQLPLPGASVATEVELRLDGRVFGFALMLSVLTSLIFGLAPAWAATKPDVVSALKDEPGMSGRRKWLSLRNSLVVAQIATSLTLLSGAGLSTRSLRNIQTMDLGFDTGNGLVMTLDLGMLKYDKERGLQFYTQFIERLATTPGVRSIIIANHLPLDTPWGYTNISIEGQPPVADGRPMNAVRQNIGLRYFGTMGIPLLRGRDFTAQDTASSEPVVIINETMARRHWPKLKDIGEVVGQRIRIGSDLEQRLHIGSDQDAKLTTIIGVAVDTKTLWLIGEKREGMWTPISQNFSPSFQALVRTNAEETSTVSALRREVAALDPNLPIKIITLREHIRSQTRAAEMFAGLLTSLGGVGLLLTAIGLYGVMSYAVAQRTREIGIRMSLGARAPDVLKMIIRHGMRLTLAGLAIGLVAALAIMRVVRSLFYEVSAHDPITFVVVLLALSAVALLACYVPARRATKVDPLAALRHE
jgi:macrolide transport system ATP-binding/permease protein